VIQDKIKQRVLDAFLLVMRPVVRILLRYGIGFREFAEVTKTAFVDVASSDFGLRGRPTNISRVAVMTGLTRKEVKRLRDKIESGDSTISVRTTPLADVLHNWHAQSEFTNNDGVPRALPFAGKKGSFTALVKKYGGDVPPGAMRTEMKRVGAVEETINGELQMTRRSFVSDKSHENLVTMLVHGVYPLLCNVAHNTDPERSDTDWGYRIAYTQALPLAGQSQLRRIAANRIAEFAESIDDIFIAYESLNSDSGRNSQNEPIAVGVFYFEERDSDANYNW
jgi:hypothetical protein